MGFLDGSEDVRGLWGLCEYQTLLGKGWGGGERAVRWLCGCEGLWGLCEYQALLGKGWGVGLLDGSVGVRVFGGFVSIRFCWGPCEALSWLCGSEGLRGLCEYQAWWEWGGVGVS